MTQNSRYFSDEMKTFQAGWQKCAFEFCRAKARRGFRSISLEGLFDD